MQTLKLNENSSIPILGFGTWQITGSRATRAVEKALEVGYRLIDTADIYGNHEEVGQAIANSTIPRKEIFLTTKIWRSYLHREGVLECGKRFLEELKTDYIDLLLIHWPTSSVPVRESLEAMNELKEQGIVKAIGVSNFFDEELVEALDCGVEITNDQVELHPSLNQKNLKGFCDEHNIVVTAYSPLGRGKEVHGEEVEELAKKYAKTPSQIILNWIIQRGIVAIPKAAKEEHIEENFKATEFELASEDMELINQIPQNGRIFRV